MSMVTFSTAPPCSSQYGETSVPPPASPSRKGRARAHERDPAGIHERIRSAAPGSRLASNIKSRTRFATPCGYGGIDLCQANLHGVITGARSLRHR